MMWHTDSQDRSKLVRECRLPLTGRSLVSRGYTNLVVFEPAGARFVCRRLADGVPANAARSATAADLEFDLT